MELTLAIATTMCIGLMIGTEFTVSVFINPTLAKLDETAWVHATKLFAQKLGFVMPFWYVTALLLLIAEMITMRGHAGVALLAAASAIWAAVIVLTLMFLVPIANRLAKMDDATFSETLRRQSRTWDAMHRWRVFALAVAMVLMLVGVRG